MSPNPKQDYFNQLAAAWDTLPAPPDSPARVRRFVERVAAPQSRRILDVGCGTGILARLLAEAHPAASCLVELDFALEMLREARAKHPAAPIHPLCADARSLPFPEGSFDLVVCFGVLPHLGEPATVIGELLRVLEPAGTFAVGHIMGSRELNALHHDLGGPVAEDRLPAARDLAALLSARGAAVLTVEDVPQSYLVRARKVAA